MNNPPSLSIVMPVYNHLDLLLNLFATLGPTMPPSPVEIIVVDDASTEFDLRKVRTLADANVIRLERNGGYPVACNAGAKAAKGDVILFLNSDIEAHSGWYEPLMGAFLRPGQETVAVVGVKTVFPVQYWCPACRIYGPTDTCNQGHKAEAVELIQSCGGWFDAGKGPYHRYLGWRSDHPLCNVAEDVSWVTGAAMAVRGDVLRQMQGFDEGYVGGYFEDVDLCMRVKKAGWRVWYEPWAVFTHLVGGSFVQQQPGKVNTFRLNSKRFHWLWEKEIRVDNKAVRVVDY